MDRKNHSKVARGGEPAQFLLPRLVAVVGHYGSGKTTVAVNMAMRYARAGERVAVVDFDIVNPYFRTADSRDMLESAGVHCVVPPLANTNVDVPALPAEIYSLFAGSGGAARFDRVIFDVGGDDGAVALSAYRAHFYREPHALLYVVSMYRPLTATPEAAAELLGEIEALRPARHACRQQQPRCGDDCRACHLVTRLRPTGVRALRVAAAFHRGDGGCCLLT